MDYHQTSAAQGFGLQTTFRDSLCNNFLWYIFILQIVYLVTSEHATQKQLLMGGFCCF